MFCDEYEQASEGVLRRGFHHLFAFLGLFFTALVPLRLRFLLCVCSTEQMHSVLNAQSQMFNTFTADARRRCLHEAECLANQTPAQGCDGIVKQHM